MFILNMICFFLSIILYLNRWFTSDLFASTTRWLSKLLPNPRTQRRQIYAVHKVNHINSIIIIIIIIRFIICVLSLAMSTTIVTVSMLCYAVYRLCALSLHVILTGLFYWICQDQLMIDSFYRLRYMFAHI